MNCTSYFTSILMWFKLTKLLCVHVHVVVLKTLNFIIYNRFQMAVKINLDTQTERLAKNEILKLEKCNTTSLEIV